MKTTILVLATLFLVFSTPASAQENDYSVKVNITNIKSNDGTIQVGLYNSEENFLRKPHKSIEVKAKENAVNVTFENLQPGEYAISLYHDKDDNQRLNTFFRIPTEPYGVSNNAKGSFGPPQWVHAKFIVEDRVVIQNIKL